MKCTIPEISWHNRDPVLSIDIQTQVDAGPVRLATGGTDSHVLIWYVNASGEGSTSVEIAADLTRHEKAVNVVRWSPSSELLASGDDDNVIIIWKQRTATDPPMILEQNNEADREVWASIKVLRGHLKDVYDISWSHCSNFLISGSVDNTAIMWNVAKGRSFAILDDHKNFVQGVCWDPSNKYVATMSSDRTCRVYDIKTKKNVSRSSKGKPLSNADQTTRLYHDDTLQSFFRRLCFSPDGMLLVVPSGIMEKEAGKIINTTYIYTKYSFKLPVITLPSKEYSVAAKFCPLLFCLRNSTPVIPLPYRMIVAVATRSSVILYDTEQSVPFAMISNIHYTRLTDISWSSDGRILAVSSTDGFCSIITFAEKELGEVYEKEDLNKDVGDLSSKEISDVDSQLNKENGDTPAFDEVANDGMEPELANSLAQEENADDIRLVIEDSQTECEAVSMGNESKKEMPNLKDKVEVINIECEEKKKKCDKPIDVKTPRRVQLITLSSPKSSLKIKEDC